jgi:glycosyltransferase involved in cell wall biosynthesis
MQSEDLKIFIGPTSLVGVSLALTSALREKGIRVTHAITRISPFRPDMEYDILLNFQGLNKLQMIIKYLYYFLKFFLQYNTFIFLSGQTLLPYNLDLPVLKLFRKKTIMWFMGSDIRHYESLETAAQKAGLKYIKSKDQGAGPKTLKRKMRMIYMVEKHVDYIISYPSFSQLLRRKYHTIFLPVVDMCDIRYNNIPNPRPIVVHAPSDDEFKGTFYVVKAVEQLKREGYVFEFRLLRNTPNKIVRETVSRADIAIDELFEAMPGGFSIESMAAGCAVLGGNVPGFSGFPPELPIIHTDPSNIYQNLKMLLENPELRRELGEKGRKYVEKYHDHRKIANDIIELITGNKDM